MTKILDCTTRDGGHVTNWNFNDEFVFDLMNELNYARVAYFEIGYRNRFDTDGKGNFYHCSPEFLQKFYDKKGNLQIGVMTDAKRYSEEDFAGAGKDYIDFVRIACHPDMIGETLIIAENLHNKGYKVFVQLMDVSNIDENGFFELFKFKNKNILESLYFADSYGVLEPSDIEKYFQKLKMLGYDRISFHGHNKSANVLQNSIKACEIGVFSVDTTKDGIGRCGGNLPLKKLLEEKEI